MDTNADVVVVGAGPTGLLLAGDLAEAGVDTLVLERRVEVSGITRAFALHARTLEMLDARGLADEVISTGQQVSELSLFDRIGLDFSGLRSRFPYVLITPQYHTEAALRQRAEAAGVRFMRGCEFSGLRQDPDGVDVETHGGSVRCSYLVGADGVRSTVRTQLGLAFPGRAIVRSLMLADVRLTDAPDDVLAVNASDDSFAFVAPFGDGWFRVFAWDRRNPLPDSAPVDLEEVRAVTHRALGTDFGMHEARWLSRFHSDERQVGEYRVGRVFLAGDAAHVHTPAGGLGMNTGLQDAANLGWKLAAAVHGYAPAGLLDTYHAERHPVGRQVLRISGGLVRMAMIRSRIGRATRNALVRIVLRSKTGSRLGSETMSGIGIAYATPPGAHRLAGHRAEDVPLVTRSPGRRCLYEELRGGHFVLLTPSAGVVRVPTGWDDRVRQAINAQPTTITRLVRPDGYVAWAAPTPDAAALREALTNWCGAPA